MTAIAPRDLQMSEGAQGLERHHRGEQCQKKQHRLRIAQGQGQAAEKQRTRRFGQGSGVGFRQGFRRRGPELVGEVQEVQRARVSDEHEDRMSGLSQGGEPQNCGAKPQQIPDQEAGDESRRSAAASGQSLRDDRGHTRTRRRHGQEVDREKVASPYHDIGHPSPADGGRASLRYSMLSPCSEMSRPSRSCSSVTRRPMSLSITTRSA